VIDIHHDAADTSAGLVARRSLRRSLLTEVSILIARHWRRLRGTPARKSVSRAGGGGLSPVPLRPVLERHEDTKVWVALLMQGPQVLHRRAQLKVFRHHEIGDHHAARARDALAAVDEDGGVATLRQDLGDEVSCAIELGVEFVPIHSDVVPEAEAEVLGSVRFPGKMLCRAPTIDDVGHVVGVQQIARARRNIIPQKQSRPDPGNASARGARPASRREILRRRVTRRAFQAR